MWIKKEHLFTVSSAMILLFQYYIFNQNIQELRKENEKLISQIKTGHKRHLEIVKEKTLEKNAVIASYEYTINKELSKEEDFVKFEDFRNGYSAGFKKAIEDSK